MAWELVPYLMQLKSLILIINQGDPSIMKKLFSLFLIMATFILSCHNPTNSESSEIATVIIPSTESVSSSGSLRSQLTEARIDTGVSYISSYYSGYGNLVASVTPSMFYIPLDLVEISSSDSYAEVVPHTYFDESTQLNYIQHLDFTSSVGSSAGRIEDGNYTDFLFEIALMSDIFSGGSDTNGLVINKVVLDLPNQYSGQNLITDQIATATNPNYLGQPIKIGTEFVYKTRVLDETEAIYQVDLFSLIPNSNLNKLTLWFSGNEYIVYEVPDGKTEHYLSDYKSTPGTNPNSSEPFFCIPWNSISISSEAASVEFVLNWDLKNIVQIYDNNTPGDLSDDILVLVDNYWERIGLKAVQYDADGNLIE